MAMTYSHTNGATPMSTHVEAIPQVANVVTCVRFMRSGYLHLCQYWPASAQHRHSTGTHQRPILTSLTQYRHSAGMGITGMPMEPIHFRNLCHQKGNMHFYWDIPMSLRVGRVCGGMWRWNYVIHRAFYVMKYRYWLL